MIIAVDVETRGLDCTKFVMACLIKENVKTPILFKSKKKLWNYIIELGKSEYNRGKVLNVYSHNATYDFYSYADLYDKNIKYFSHRPFIVAYVHNGKEIIKFLDTWAIFRMSLKAVGDMIGLPKLETPERLLNSDTRVTEGLYKEITPYLIRDTEIVMESIKKLKLTLKENGIHVRRIYTINQLAINYLINQWRKMDDPDIVFWNIKKGETRRVFRADEIHSAYRGGRVEAFRTGIMDGVYYVDCNSLYPYSACNIEFPDLRTERKTWRPLETMHLKDLLNKLGLSRVLLFNKDNELGFIPVRTSFGNYYPRKGRYILGTYTHMELKKALEEGYEVLGVEWSVTYERANENPFINVFEKLYELRQTGGSDFNSYFYKMMMNAGLGKLAQTRTGQEIFVDSVEKAEEYLAKNYDIVKGIKYNYMYTNKNKESVRKKYYQPSLPAFVNAYARCYMYDWMKLIPIDKIVYTDTDSIMTIGDFSHLFPISRKMGDFKVEYSNERAVVYGRKTYSIGEDIKLSGIRKKNLNKDDFEKGYVTDKKMITIRTTGNIEDVGKFAEESRDLKEQLVNHNKLLEMLEGEVLLIDSDIDDVSFFVPLLSERNIK